MSFKRRLNDELQQEFFSSDNNTFPAGSDNEYRVYRLKVQQPTVRSSANSQANVATL
ncbi:hypothetical protein [Sphingobacterium siyangense]|uniref:hypothetical protein n=1 Tax=Sphingobacterium siyangense TaxID=459529 RepID=UPI001603DC54|nr:hypothetical protein [Sphingobacterium siyangense]